MIDISCPHRQSWVRDSSACNQCPQCRTPPQEARQETWRERPVDNKGEIFVQEITMRRMEKA